MIIDWSRKEAEGCDWALVHDSGNYINYEIDEPNISSTDYFNYYIADSMNCDVNHWTLHERPEAEQMKETFYTKEMHEAGEECEVGMTFQDSQGCKYVKLLESDSEGFTVIKNKNSEYSLFCQSGIKPIDTHKDKEKAIDDINYILMNEVAAKSTRQIAEHIVNKLEYLTFTGDK